MSTNESIQDVHLLVLDTLADWEVGYTVAYVNRPSPGVPSRYRVRTVGLDGSPITTVGGIRIVPDLTLSEVRASSSAMLILPGSDLWAEAKTDPALAKAKEFVKAGVPVAAICGAVFGLARAGLLDDRKHTSNDPGWLASSGYQGGAHHASEPAVDDRGIITASATAPIDLARLVLARLSVFSEKALEAWYGLYKTGNPACYFAFTEAVGQGHGAAS